MDPKRQSLVKVARQWQRDQPEQFAELVALIMKDSRKPAVRVETAAA